MAEFDKILSVGDLRSIGKSNSIIMKIKIQNDFDELFKYLFHEDRLTKLEKENVPSINARIRKLKNTSH